MPSLRALQCLVAVHDHGSVTKAAVALGLTQPALSHQLASLRSNVGFELVTRGSGGVRLTAAGRAVLPQARAAVDAERSFTTQARRVAGLREGDLRICCAQSLTAGLLPPVLRRWSQKRREVSILLTEYHDADRVAAAVAAGVGDFGICPAPTAWRGPVTVLGWEEVVVAMSSDDPLSARPTVDLAAVTTRPLIHYNAGHGLAAWVDATFAAAGLTPRVAVRTGQTSATATLAASGIGVALVPLSAVPARYRGVIRRLDPPRGRELVVLRQAGGDPLSDAFVRDLVTLGVPRLHGT